MLIGFKLRNFRSFCREQTFEYPGFSGRRSENSRVAVIFGASGAGKTNLIRGLATLRNLVLHSVTYTDKQYAELYTPFQFDCDVQDTTDFEIEIQLDQTRYRYTVQYDAQRIWFERLLVYRTGKPQRWFERHYDPATQAYEWAAFSPSFNGTRELWRRMTRPKALFLTTAARLVSEQLQPFVRWFEHGLAIWYATQPYDIGAIAASARDPIVKERMLSVLRAVDIPVADIRIAEGASDEFTAHASDGHRLELLHEGPGEAPLWLDSAEEAGGTLRLLSLLGPLLPALEHGTLLVVDEFDAGLHPIVARYLIQFAKRAGVDREGVQVLLTSHDASLLVPEVLHHDEIWLMERDAELSSCLLPVSVRGPRKGERLSRGYLQGRYGAIPRIKLEGIPPPTLDEPTEDATGSFLTQRASA